ncbi:MAG: hypothetical protein LWW96_14265 [Acidovorax sp.]|uniref:hypothetical protein n=1 Tax=Acidovorax sp. TaxID=1872122 RepID=UPI0025BD81B2|nr:hypothetical protein [Acidovorax sp.]MCE1193307.1 hypothetical protein [Acidovorax sp.]
MDIDGKLVFTVPADGSGRLVFGESDGGVVVPEAVITVDGDLPGLGTLTLRAGTRLGIDAELPGLDGTIGLAWDANVSRGLRAEVQTCWQEARPVATGTATAWQDSEPVRAAVAANWQEGKQMAAAVESRWQESKRMRAGVVSSWQAGIRLRNAVASGWQESERLRAAIKAAWQQGEGRRGAVLSTWQETERLRSGVAAHWQDGAPVRRALLGHWGDGSHIRQVLRAHWQQGRRPPPGVSFVPPVEPPEQPCYDPATVGRLVFTDMWLGDGRLVFVCQRPGQVVPPATVIVPIQRVYMTINNVSLARADGEPIPAQSFGMSLDMDSWTWQWSATLHGSALPLITPGPGGEPVQVIVTINGAPYRLLSESYSRERRFGKTTINVKGRGVTALLDVPYSPALNHGNSLARTAHQLMSEVLTINGVPFGWGVDWRMTDWLVPGGLWTHQGSFMSALADIAAAAGGYIQPRDTEQTVIALPRYPAAPWDWGDLTPDFELPSAVVSVEGIEWLRKATYDRVFVSGVADGIEGRIKRAGTAGTLVAPSVTHPLITDMEAARQRGIAELGNTGVQAHISLRLPVLESTGVIKPGALVRYVDGSTTHLGYVRATSLEWSSPTLRQVLSVETHPE